MFSNDNYLLELREERHVRQKNQDYFINAKLKELVSDLNETDSCLIIHAKNTYAWLNVLFTTVTITVFLDT